MKMLRQSHPNQVQYYPTCCDEREGQFAAQLQNYYDQYLPKIVRPYFPVVQLLIQLSFVDISLSKEMIHIRSQQNVKSKMEQLIDFDNLAENGDLSNAEKQNFISPWGNLPALHSLYTTTENVVGYRIRSLTHSKRINKSHDQSIGKAPRPLSFIKGSSYKQKDQTQQRKRISLHNSVPALSNQKKSQSSQEVVLAHLTNINKSHQQFNDLKKQRKPFKSINIHEQFLRRLNLPYRHRRNLKLEETHLPMLNIISFTANSSEIVSRPLKSSQYQ